MTRTADPAAGTASSLAQGQAEPSSTESIALRAFALLEQVVNASGPMSLDELTLAYSQCREDPAFQKELAWELEHYVGRPSPIYHARRLSEEVGGAQIYLKREDLNHTGAHKVNNTVGQALLARKMGKPRVIAETGAGQHGVATATVAARYGMECVVYMGSET